MLKCRGLNILSKLDQVNTPSPQRACRGLNYTSSALIDAHIIPAGFGRIIMGDGPNMSLTLDQARTAKPQLGEFDRNILCKDCDHKLGYYDDYAIGICKAFKRRHEVVEKNIFELTDVDGDKLAKFVLSVLWRASISNRASFSQVALGPYEDKVRDVVFGARDLTSLPAFQVLMQRYVSDHLDMEGIYTLPARTSYRNLNFYWFMLTGFRVMAKIDARPLPRELAELVVGPDQKLRGILLEFEKTSEFSRVRDIAVNELRRGKP